MSKSLSAGSFYWHLFACSWVFSGSASEYRFLYPFWTPLLPLLLCAILVFPLLPPCLLNPSEAVPSCFLRFPIQISHLQRNQNLMNVMLYNPLFFELTSLHVILPLNECYPSTCMFEAERKVWTRQKGQHGESVTWHLKLLLCGPKKCR